MGYDILVIYYVSCPLIPAHWIHFTYNGGLAAEIFLDDLLNEPLRYSLHSFSARVSTFCLHHKCLLIELVSDLDKGWDIRGRQCIKLLVTE